VSVIKICGLTRVEDAVVASDSGADFLGLIFHRPSTRYIATEMAAALVKALGDQALSARWIGVFVDESPDEVRRIADTVGLDGVQLHGSETPKIVERLRQEGLLVIKGHRIAGSEDLARLDTFEVDAHLLDTHVTGSPGGTGKTFDWSLAARVSGERRILLAGGLTVSNVAEAIARVNPWGVDVSSGVESAPGVKDPDKIRRFIAVARDAFAREGGRDEQGR